MATSSEYGATSNAIRTANNTAAIGFPQENRRKSAFKSLVSDVADQLGSKEVTDICWHKDVHLSSKERLPLDVLMWLVKHGTFSENEVRPLAQLLKDIHREDLIARVEKFEEEFGRHYSVPAKSHSSAVDHERRANTISGSHPITSQATNTESMSTESTLTTEACQKSHALSVDNETASGCLYIPNHAGKESPHLPHYWYKLHSELDDTEAYSVQSPTEGQHSGVATLHHDQPPNNASHPSSYSTSESNLPQNSGFSKPEIHHKIYHSSVPFTAESSSASSSILEISPEAIANSAWQFSSNPSSSNVSQENILNSSRSDIMESKINVVQQHRYQSRLSQPTPIRGPHNQPLNWYQTSLTSLPPPEYEQWCPGIPEGTSISMHQPSIQPVVPIPMNRSRSQDYHRPTYNLYGQRHRFSLAPHPYQTSAAFDPRLRAQFGITPEEPNFVPQQYIPYQGPQNQHCGQFSNEGYQPEYHMHMAHTQCRLPSMYYAPVEQRKTMSSDETSGAGVAMRGWGSDEYEEKNSSKVINVKHRKSALQQQAHLLPSVNTVPEVHNPDLGPGCATTRERATQNLRSPREVATNQMNMSQPQPVTLEYRSDHYSSMTHESVPSLDTYSNTSTKRGPKHMSRSSSTGNASVNNTSEHNLGSMATLTSSFSQASLNSPLSTRSRANTGSKEYNDTSSHADRSVSLTASATIAHPKWKQLFFHPKPKPRLIKPNELVWPIKHDKLNKYIYKHKTKLLTCKVRLELASEHSSSPDLKLTLQLHPYGAEEDYNKSITAKVSIELAKKCRLHSKTSIEFQISATASGNQDNPSSEIEIGKLQQRYEQITQNFFYIKKFIIHEELKKSQCDYVQVIASAKLHA